MSTNHTVTLSLGRITRSNESSFWEYIDEIDVCVWEKAGVLLSKKHYTHEGCDALISVDWSKVVLHIKNMTKLNIEYHMLLDKKEGLNEFFENHPESDDLIISCEIMISGKNKFIDYQWYPRFFVEKYIYDFFTIMNLSTPGSCDFLNVRFFEKGKPNDDRLLLSSYNFEDALHLALEGKKPSVKVIDIEIVANWYESLNLGIRQKAEAPIEKALFSLMHLCRMDGDISSVVWIFHSLEAIYSTRVGESFTNLINRISILLELSQSDTTKLKKNLRKLYDHRSSIVHGGYEVHHPIGFDAADPRLDDDISNNFELIQLGFNLIIASIQALIEKNWYGLTITESLSGVESPNKTLLSTSEISTAEVQH
jgi:hypothetical protein